jgi:outer membrane autotransporter protein
MGKMMPKLVKCAAVLLLAAAGSPAAWAQTAPNPNDCAAYVSTQSGTVLFNECGAGQQARFSTIYVPQVVQRALKNSFGFGPLLVEPAGLSEVIADDTETRLAPSAMVIAPTADAAPTAPAANSWNAWVDGRYLYSDYTNAAGDLDGATWSGLAGLDYKLTSKLTVGFLVSGEGSDLEGGGTDLTSTTYGIGPYLGIVLTDNIVFSANLLGSRMDSEQAAGALNFDTDRVQASAALTGYWYKDTWRFTPGLTVSWSKDWEEEDNGLLPDRTIEVGIFTPSVQFGNTITLSDKATMEPWIGAALDWTFLNDIHTSGGGTDSDPSTDVRLQAGLNFGFGANAQLALTGEYSGLLMDDLVSYSGAINLAIQF